MTILMPRLIADRIVDWRINSTHEQASQIYDVTPLQQLCLQHGGGNCSQQQDAAVTPRIECWQNVGNAHAQIAMQQNAKKSNFITFSSHTRTHTHTHTHRQASKGAKQNDASTKRETSAEHAQTCHKTHNSYRTHSFHARLSYRYQSPYKAMRAGNRSDHQTVTPTGRITRHDMWQLQPKVLQTVQQHCLVWISLDT